MLVKRNNHSKLVDQTLVVIQFHVKWVSITPKAVAMRDCSANTPKNTFKKSARGQTFHTIFPVLHHFFKSAELPYNDAQYPSLP